MQVKFLNNLGSNDAAALKLEHSECTKGACLEVKDNIGEFLAVRQLAEIIAVAKPPEVKAVETLPSEETISNKSKAFTKKGA